MGPPSVSDSPAASARKTSFSQARSMSNTKGSGEYDRDGLWPPSRPAIEGRSMSNASMGLAFKGASTAPSAPAPGSFSSALKITSNPRGGFPRSDISAVSGMDFKEDDESSKTVRRQAVFRDEIDKETKIKIGSENLLEALHAKNPKQTKDQRLKVESELTSSNRKIAQLKDKLKEEIQRSKVPSSPPRRLSSPLRGNAILPASRDVPDSATNPLGLDLETESPTYVLSEILQALEAEGLPPDYYVERSNSLVELFKRHPYLKYDLAWSVFGLRIQTMLLSDSREVVAAGYRLTRYAITDRRSVQIIRELQTDYLVILSLVKEGKASVEREQALKLVRALLDVEDGVYELSCAVVRTIVAVAENPEDRLRNICLLTLAEILTRNPPLLVSAGGIGPLADTLAEGNYQASESLVTAFLYLLDLPSRRAIFRSGHELEAVFSVFTDPLAIYSHEARLRTNAKVIAVMLKTWPGIMTLSMTDFIPIKSLLSALYFPAPQLRSVLLDLLFDILRIKPPSWSSSFLAGRRLTTYGRVANLKPDLNPTLSIPLPEEEGSKMNLVEHFTALILAVFFKAGLVEALTHVLEDSPDPTLKRKTTLLLGEVLKLANRLLPATWSANLQALPELFSLGSSFGAPSRFVATSTVYQVDSVNRTLYRSGPAVEIPAVTAIVDGEEQPVSARQNEQTKSGLGIQIDEGSFRSLLLETHVLNTVNYTKWKWDLIESIIEGPLLNPKRLDEAIKASKFVKRLFGFYRPFKFRFANAKNTKPNQRYVRVGCSLLRTLLKNPDGVKYIAENKLLRQIAECLAQLDRTSGLTSASPLFSPSRLLETMSGGYFALLGTLSSDPKGLQMMERWHIINMFYHIIELPDRDDLIRTLLINMDFTLDSHLRVILSKALTTCSKEIRNYSTKLLRKYATGNITSSKSPTTGTENAEWAIRLLVTQLYDPDVEVCGVAVKILEEACNRKHCLEFVVKCRPALDHLGEIGAPLLLRFLSTSVGYHYLDGLDYIMQEMDDWFLGRNDSYVTLVEASLAQAFMDPAERPQTSSDDISEHQDYGLVPPHFYRELTRTTEGCKLLRKKGHFNEFVSTIRDLGLENDDPETILKVKGCLWAVGNVGSMELGAPFLEETDVVKWVVRIAENSEIMTMRGTAFFTLGLISRSLHGLEILAEYGWDGTTNSMGESLGFCMPLDLQKLFSIQPWYNTPNDAVNELAFNRLKAAVTDEDPMNARILGLVVDLGNTVLSKRAATDLHNIKVKKPEYFQQPHLFHKVMTVLESHHFRLLVRRFVIDLFDKGVLRQIVLEEDESSGYEEQDVSPNGTPP
ncbi:MAG: hypothetical protein M1819_006473 [Sarea resinae]|nr:MAG: hypothetical protein M1819_006473 [Sarea resinae]